MEFFFTQAVLRKEEGKSKFGLKEIYFFFFACFSTLFFFYQSKVFSFEEFALKSALFFFSCCFLLQSFFHYQDLFVSRGFLYHLLIVSQFFFLALLGVFTLREMYWGIVSILALFHLIVMTLWIDVWLKFDSHRNSVKSYLSAHFLSLISFSLLVTFEISFLAKLSLISFAHCTFLSIACAHKNKNAIQYSSSMIREYLLLILLFLFVSFTLLFHNVLFLYYDTLNWFEWLKLILNFSLIGFQVLFFTILGQYFPTQQGGISQKFVALLEAVAFFSSFAYIISQIMALNFYLTVHLFEIDIFFVIIFSFLNLLKLSFVFIYPYRSDFKHQLILWFSLFNILIFFLLAFLSFVFQEVVELGYLFVGFLFLENIVYICLCYLLSLIPPLVKDKPSSYKRYQLGSSSFLKSL